MIIVLMGVSGTGKSTVGAQLARELGWTFVEGDDFHSAENIARMQAGIPLDDAARRPWLASIRLRIEQAATRGENLVLACSALKHRYQQILTECAPGLVRLVFLTAPESILHERLERRRGHFMGPGMLQSQLDTVEPPADGLTIDVSPPPAEIVSAIRARLGL